MAFFGVTKEVISASWHHPKADRLSLCTLKGMDFQFVTLKDQFQVGDEVLYFPLDSILPDHIIAIFGLQGKLAGPQFNRIKTAMLRSEISQGLVEIPSKFLTPDQMNLDSEAITKVLGVTKYEPIPNEISDAVLYTLPTGLSAYDIEGADRYVDIANELMDLEVQITEKMEGMNFSITQDIEDKIFVNMRQNTIVPIEGAEHMFWKVAREQGLIALIPQIKEYLISKLGYNTGVTLYGEVCGPGIPTNIYNLKEKEVFFFDIKVSKGFLNVPLFEEVVKTFNLSRTPLLSLNTTLRTWLDGKSIKQASTGKTLLNPTQHREGIVIKPIEEGRCSRGRLILKQRCPIYLKNETD